MQPIEILEDTCPYCGSKITVELDLTTIGSNFVEDCSTCCAPILYKPQIDGRGEIVQIKPHRENE